MGVYWWLSLLACISCCILSKAEDHDEQLLNDASDDSEERSVRGFRPCLDESCSVMALGSEEDLTWHVLSKVLRTWKPVDHVSDSETGDSDSVVEYCMPLRTSTINHVRLIEERHPDIKDVKTKVIGDFIRFISDFASLNTSNCDSSMSLIGYITLALKSLQVKYSQTCGELCSCTYMAGVADYFASFSTTESPTVESMDHDTSTYPPLDDEAPLGDEGYRTPCPEHDAHDSYEETYAEDQHHSYGSSILVGSIRGVPGVHFPNYTEIPLTSFSCADKKYIPGFYADIETDCQVFHVCYEHRRESFLCPLGTIFNQPLLACDYWYSSNCSLSTDYYEVNVKSEEEIKEESKKVIKDIIEDEETEITEDHSESTDEAYEEVDTKQVEEHSESIDEVEADVDIRQFLPVKAKVIDFEKPLVKGKESITMDKQAAQDVQEVASQIFDNIVSTATDIASKTLTVVGKVPEPDQPKLEPSSLDLSALKPILAAKKIAGVKIAAAAPVAKVASVKTAIPVAKFVAAKVPLAAKAVVAAKVPLAAKAVVAAAVPVAKVAAATAPLAAKAVVAAAIPVAKVASIKTTIPVVAAKKVTVKAAAVPMAKVAAIKTSIPIIAAKKVAVKAAAVPVAKVAAVKTAIPVAAKIVPLAAKAAVAAAVPVAKIAAVKTAVPVAAKVATFKTAIPVAAKAPVAVKAKLLAVPAKKVVFSGIKAAAAVPKLGVPVLKTKMLAPAMKGKVLKTASVPVLKAKVLPIKGSLVGLAPVAKAKLIKTAAISPLTKKALALGYMKLLKAKKLALMG